MTGNPLNMTVDTSGRGKSYSPKVSAKKRTSFYGNDAYEGAPDDGIEPVYPEMMLPAGRALKVARVGDRLKQAGKGFMESPAYNDAKRTAATMRKEESAFNRAETARMKAESQAEKAARKKWDAENPAALKARKAVQRAKNAGADKDLRELNDLRQQQDDSKVGTSVPKGTAAYKNTNSDEIDPYMYKKGGVVKAKKNALPSFLLNRFKKNGKGPMKMAEGGATAKELADFQREQDKHPGYSIGDPDSYPAEPAKAKTPKRAAPPVKVKANMPKKMARGGGVEQRGKTDAQTRFAKGGMVRSIDGCAQRGRTRA